jgi:tetratricopeptide (TPR) repeat protein/tRNA A-37 threonylcarbamoyl transferase component Bud32
MQSNTIDIVRGELERLFSLEEMTQLSEKLLGLDPTDVGGTSAKASFARALTERCVDGDRLDALVDVIRVSRREVDPRLFDVVSQLGREELAPGRQLGDFTVQKKLGESEQSVVYQAVKDGRPYTLKVLRKDVCRDQRAVQRYLTANRFVSGLAHAGLPEGIVAGELDEEHRVYVAYNHLEGQTLAARLAQTGPAHVNELRPILRGILEPLAQLHKNGLIHGDLKLENVLLAKKSDPREQPGAAGPSIVLIDFGGDKLTRSRVVTNGHSGVLAVVGSPKTIAPELVRGKPADQRSDVYAFGAMLYELLSGKPVFAAANATDATFAHLTKEPEPPSLKAPRGWVTKEVDDFVLSLLSKDPSRRPKDADSVLAGIAELGRASQALRAQKEIPKEKVEALVLALLNNPVDEEAQIALEKTVEEGAEPVKVAEAFMSAAQRVMPQAPEQLHAKKGLLFRAARIFETHVRDKNSAERAYAAIVELDPIDDVALGALEEVRRALGKFEEIVEMLLTRSASVPAGEDRARCLAEIGRLYVSELDDPEQALVAYTQALCELPANDEFASRVEELAGSKIERWNETLASVTEQIQAGTLSPTDQTQLLCYAGRWYEAKLGRADLALMAFQQVLGLEPAHEKAGEGLTQIYRRAQQWPELVGILLSRADAAGSTPRARDYRVEAADLLETKLNDPNRASHIYDGVLGEDPGHIRASDAVSRIAERMGDYSRLVRVLENRAEARRGYEKAEALARVAEVYEDHMNDLAEATRRFEAVLAVDPTNVTALRGLDRIFNRTGRYRELLEVLERQVQHAATPRQKINLFERIAGLHDEEFLDHTQAAAALEEILKIDGTNDAALTGLVRHYRALDRWDRVVALYDKHAQITTDNARKLELLVAKARVLAEQVGSPDRAMKVYEQVLQIQPDHAGALEALAHLKEMTGDAHAALSAIEALAFKAQTPEAKAEQWMRAARLLESKGDRDGAIERYKLALESNPKDAAAATALRKAYGDRGDNASVVSLIEKELQTAEGALAKGRLYAELAKVQHQALGDKDKADAAAKKALELDATNVEALMVLGDIAYEGGRMLEASRHLDSVVGRTGMLKPEDAVRVLVRFLEAFGKANRPSVPPQSMPSMPGGMPSSGDVGGPPSGGRISVAPPASVAPPPVTNPRMMAAVEALRELAPADVEAMARATDALFEFGDPKSALKMSEDLLSKHSQKLAGSERALALFHLGESARRCGELEKAVAPLREAAGLDASNPKPLRSLAKVFEEKGDFAEALKVKRQRLTVATGGERFELLLEIGDLELNKLQNKKGAEKSYQQALQERPDDRKLLAKLMQLYSEEKDWAKLVEVVLRLADFVEDKKQRAKYMHTAATIATRHLQKDEQALGFYEEALACDPTLQKAADEAIELSKKRGEHVRVKKILEAQLEQAKQAADRARIVKVLDALGDLYRKFLNEPEMAIDAFEAAQAFDPEERTRQEMLAELYASDVKQYLDKAVRAQAAILKHNPYRVQSYKLLRKLFTDAKKADPAWCLCQALSVLNLAEPDEERFYRKHRAENAAAAQAAFGETEWERIAHPEADALLTKIFALIQPTIIRTRTQPLEALGYDPRYAIDTSLHPYPVSQTLYYAQGVLGVSGTKVFQNPNDPSALGFIHAQTPAIVLGRGAFDTTTTTQALAFIAGRHLVYFRPGYYVRHLVPTGTGLKAWLFAAIKLCVPQFPIAPDLQGQVNEAMNAMAVEFNGVAKDKLASLVSKLLQSGGALDLKKWVTSIDFTADRAGLVLAHDLQTATEVARTTEEASSAPVKERMKELVLFGISEEYFALRQKLNIAIDS